jgi:hypothetical protein
MKNISKLLITSGLLLTACEAPTFSHPKYAADFYPTWATNTPCKPDGGMSGHIPDDAERKLPQCNPTPEHVAETKARWARDDARLQRSLNWSHASQEAMGVVQSSAIVNGELVRCATFTIDNVTRVRCQ